MRTLNAPIAVRARLDHLVSRRAADARNLRDDRAARRAIAGMLSLWGSRPDAAPAAIAAPSPAVTVPAKVARRAVVAPATTVAREVLTLTCDGCGMPIHNRVAAVATNMPCACGPAIRAISIRPVPVPSGLHGLSPVTVIFAGPDGARTPIKIYS